MSKVTNAILHLGVLDEKETCRLLAQVNEFFGEDGAGYPQRGFVLVDSPLLPEGWYGGSRTLECTLALGAFNHLALPLFLQHLEGIAWPDREVVQLLVKEQDDDVFKIVSLDVGR